MGGAAAAAWHQASWILDDMMLSMWESSRRWESPVSELESMQSSGCFLLTEQGKWVVHELMLCSRCDLGRRAVGSSCGRGFAQE